MNEEILKLKGKLDEKNSEGLVSRKNELQSEIEKTRKVSEETLTGFIEKMIELKQKQSLENMGLSR